MKSCKTCWGYDNDMDRAVDASNCPYCWGLRQKITSPFPVTAMFCKDYKYFNWNKERQWDNETRWWKGEEKPNFDEPPTIKIVAAASQELRRRKFDL